MQTLIIHLTVRVDLGRGAEDLYQALVQTMKQLLFVQNLFTFRASQGNQFIDPRLLGLFDKFNGFFQVETALFTVSFQYNLWFIAIPIVLILALEILESLADFDNLLRVSDSAEDCHDLGELFSTDANATLLLQFTKAL